MEERYRREQEEIHAPADLIEKTKAAMKKEEEKLKKENKNKKVILGGIVTAAAAILITFVAVPYGAGGVVQKENTVHFGKESDKIAKIPNGEEVDDFDLQIEKIAEIPDSFIKGNAKEVEVLKIPISIYKDEEQGFLTAYFKIKDSLYVATGGKIDEEDFIQGIKDFIMYNQ